MFNELSKENQAFKFLSLGMSQDYNIALDCGSNMIRLGSIVFWRQKMISQVVNIVIYLILVLFLVDLTKSDSYNKVGESYKDNSLPNSFNIQYLL